MYYGYLILEIIIVAKYNKITFKNSLIIPKEKTNFVVPKIIHTSPTEGIFPKTPLPLWKFQSNFIHLLKFLGLSDPPPPPGISNPSCGGVWIFSKTTH